MIQKGIIEKLYPEENSALVRIPMYETSQGERALFTCIIKTLPGIVNGYVESDVVFVDFENDDLDYPVIVGKLYLGASKEINSKTSINADNLTVNGSAKFSEDFSISDINYKDIKGAVLATKDLYGMLDQTEGPIPPTPVITINRVKHDMLLYIMDSNEHYGVVHMTLFDNYDQPYDYAKIYRDWRGYIYPELYYRVCDSSTFDNARGDRVYVSFYLDDDELWFEEQDDFYLNGGQYTEESVNSYCVISINDKIVIF